MSDSDGKLRKRYIDYLEGKSKTTRLIHFPGNSLENSSSWETLVLSILKVGLLRTAGMLLTQKINLTEINRIMLLLTVQ